MCVKLYCWESWHLKRIRMITAMYVSSADLLHKNLAWLVVTQRTSKKHKTVKSGGWALMQGWPLARDNAVLRCKYTLKELDSTREASLIYKIASEVVLF